MKQRLMSGLVAATAVFASSLAVAAPVLRDDFSNARSGWPNMAATRSGDLGLAVYTDSGKYQMTPVEDQVFGFIPAPRQTKAGNVKMESDFFLYAGLGAGAAGLGCRHQDHRNFYGFMARGDGKLMILKVKDGKVTPLATGNVKGVMAGTVDTRLRVECKGNTLRMSASGGSSLSAQDGEFSTGDSGLFVIGEKMAGTSVQFDNFVLEDLGQR